MNTLHLGRCLGDITTTAFRRHYLSQQLQSLEHRENLSFDYSRNARSDDETTSNTRYLAHQGGTSCLSIDSVTGRYLFSAGADTTIRLWDLETQSDSQPSTLPYTYHPVASLSRANPQSHTHAITSISIYPFDPTPSTLVTTSYDRTLILHSVTLTGLTPFHKFELDFTPHSHSVCPVPSPTPLIAVGTAHPAVRLLDLRSGHSTHSLPGHNGAVYSVAWHPSHAHILFSGGVDGQILTFDVRRANAAFASFDHDDAIGVIGEDPSTGSFARPRHLDFSATAHTGPVTGITVDAHGTKLVSAGHDQRIRVWDLHTGRNDLVHFGPRVRNARTHELKPLLSPAFANFPAREFLLWPNDDGKGEIFLHGLREGNLLGILRTKALARNETAAVSRTGSAVANKATAPGRINDMCWRVNADAGEGLELYTAHGDGGIRAWVPRGALKDSYDDEKELREEEGRKELELDEEQKRKKRKRDLIGDLVQGLSKRPVTFS